MRYGIVSAIKRNEKRMKTLMELENYTKQYHQARKYVISEARKHKVKISAENITAMASMIVKHFYA